MKSTIRTVWMAACVLTLVMVAPVAAQEQGKEARPGAEKRHGRIAKRFMHRRLALRRDIRLIRGMNEEQLQLALEAAREARALRKELRGTAETEIRGFIAERRGLPLEERAGKRGEARRALRLKLGPVWAAAKERLTAIGRPLAASLTPEQRARIASRLEKLGRTPNEEKLAFRLGLLIARPGAERLLSGALERR